MEVIYILIPISLVLLAVIVGVFLWSVRSGQFDDMEGPAYRILMDDDRPETMDSEESNSENSSK